MKKIILSLGCLLSVLILVALSADAAKEPGKNYRLVQCQIGDEIPQRGRIESATVYTLICPDERVYVFRAFHSQPMEEVIKHFPRGSVLRYDGNALTSPPPEAQTQALTAFCKSSGIELVVSPTN